MWPRAWSAALRVIVQGRLRQRSYETKEGEKRTVYEVEVDEVGPSLRNASAKVTKTARPGAAAPGGQAAAGGRPPDDPWAAEPGGGFTDEPPVLTVTAPTAAAGRRSASRCCSSMCRNW
jgi:single-stranded DNA-binding protein